METNALRALVKAAAVATVGAKLWPNGLGFDCRGTSYSYNERSNQWGASRRPSGLGSAVKYGEGSTPLEAKRAAGIGRPEHRLRGGVAR